MLQLKLNGKHRIQGDKVALELLYNNLTGVGFEHHESWQLEFEEYLQQVAGLLHLHLSNGAPIVLMEADSGVVLAKSEIGGALS
jgi:hypothetical protein